MMEIRFHGRGGQGAVVASRILAAAAFLEGKDVQAFPFFGVERRGAPVTAFTKIDEKPIRIKSEIDEPDYVIVMDTALLSAVDVTQGLKKGGLVLINTEKSAEEIHEILGAEKVAVVDATEIAIRNQLGTKVQPIVNTALVGAFARASGIVKLDSVVQAIGSEVPRNPERNQQAARDAYESTVVMEFS
ncbi:MAG: 2-oxoacid:acceptor oxidoreductase family protein [Thermoplasmata archaeon]|nr:2-oxoacid:acceptor oxidoreductase family protein [Thermoplasmata archaeon]OYT50343.1 MAG: pyruvate ferredoxin oxidoreductase [Thermoplasmatales archaeon ex4484_36]RLF56117.1 MAG: pyruvate ferredoxin oxidoreductase [Thermoplasmata archaeon]RLF71877.1 MAG: pyruvate ferredoxin oxidoreductase [Thermoplasmata archaeon]RLF72191.1 MAG: pyruvate ferredoxin oxidoreductase [Thermoplasmata archaeon]